VPQGVVEGDEAPGPQQPERLLQVVLVLLLGRVAQDQVVGAVGETWQHVQGPAADDPGAVAGHARHAEGLARRALVLGLDVDRREHAVGGHAAEQPQPGDAGPRADLDDRPRGQRRSQHAQRGARSRQHRGAAQLAAPGASALLALVLDDERLRIRPCRRLLTGDGGLLEGSTGTAPGCATA
jgi:hypothetical protein